MSSAPGAKSTNTAASGSYSLAEGHEIGRYQIVRGLARGGMGEVYLAGMDVAGGRKLVALKRLRPHFADDVAVQAMFRREASLALLLDNPGITQILDVIDTEGELCIIMEYVHGRSVRDVLREKTPTLAVSLTIIAGAAAALHYAHELRDEDGRALGIVHRDVSPENVMVRFDGGVKLIDFGIARLAAQTTATAAGVLKGKVAYMSPEQIRQDPVDRRSDVFQLGVMFYELVTGVRPFEGDTIPAVMNKVLSDEVVDPRTHADGCPDAVAELILRALSFEPEDRHASAGEFRDDIEKTAATLELGLGDDVLASQMTEVFGSVVPPSLSTLTQRARPSTSRSRPRRARALLGGGLAATVIAALLAVFASSAADAAESAESESSLSREHTRARWLGTGAALVGVFGLAALGVGWRARQPAEGSRP